LRLLAPVFGSSLPVWGSAIAVVLGGLAWGYTLGGQRAQEEIAEELVFKTAILGAAIFVWMPVFFNWARIFREAFSGGGAGGLVLGSLALSILALLPASVVFGMISPMAVQVEARRRGETAGQVAGRIFTLTTMGSLFGILLPSFFTIAFLGTKETIWIFAGAVIALALPALISSGRFKLWGWLIAIILGLIAANWESARANVVWSQETPYQHVDVRNMPDGLWLTFDAGLGLEAMLPKEALTKAYWDYLALLPAWLDADKAEVLVLGAATSTTERQMTKLWGEEKSFNFTSVELDGALFSIADRFFDPPERKKVVADGRVFIAQDKKQYDIVVVDAYARELTIPFYMATREFFAEIKPRLKSRGILALNINSCQDDSLMMRSLGKTLRTVYKKVGQIAVPDSCNRLLIATDWEVGLAPVPTEGGWILTDNRAPTEWLGLAALIAKDF